MPARTKPLKRLPPFVEAESWQLHEIQKGLTELDEGRGVPHKDVEEWLRDISVSRLARACTVQKPGQAARMYS